MVKKNTCVFISGKGTNLKNLILKSRDYNFPINIKLVVCNNKKAEGIKLAKINSIPLLLVDTEKRNFEAILEAIKNKSISTENLITHKLPLKKTFEIYQLLSGKSFSLGIIIFYDKKTSINKTIKISNNKKM